jgi:hypothetical protein
VNANWDIRELIEGTSLIKGRFPPLPVKGVTTRNNSCRDVGLDRMLSRSAFRASMEMGALGLLAPKDSIVTKAY